MLRCILRKTKLRKLPFFVFYDENMKSEKKKKLKTRKGSFRIFAYLQQQQKIIMNILLEKNISQENVRIKMYNQLLKFIKEWQWISINYLSCVGSA